MRQEPHFHTGKEVVYTKDLVKTIITVKPSKKIRLEAQMLHSILHGHLFGNVINGR